MYNPSAIKYIAQMDIARPGISSIPLDAHAIFIGNVKRTMVPVKLRSSLNLIRKRPYIPSAVNI